MKLFIFSCVPRLDRDNVFAQVTVISCCEDHARGKVASGHPELDINSPYAGVKVYDVDDFSDGPKVDRVDYAF